jgi:hypothetical protein
MITRDAEDIPIHAAMDIPKLEQIHPETVQPMATKELHVRKQRLPPATKIMQVFQPIRAGNNRTII